MAAAQDDLTDYVPRHPCVLPPLTSEQVIVPLGKTATCTGCGAQWEAHWRRDPGGETQPWWDCTAGPPTDWTPPDLTDPPTEETPT